VGWRLPDSAEVNQPWRSSAPSRYLRVEGNFSGSGERETAFLLVRTDGSAFAPFVAITNDGNTGTLVQVETENPKDELAVEGLKLAPAGTYVTACGRGYGCSAGEKKTVTLSFDGVVFFKKEGPSRLIYFDPARQAFTESWLSD